VRKEGGEAPGWVGAGGGGGASAAEAVPPVAGAGAASAAAAAAASAAAVPPAAAGAAYKAAVSHLAAVLKEQEEEGIFWGRDHNLFPMATPFSRVHAFLDKTIVKSLAHEHFKAAVAKFGTSDPSLAQVCGFDPAAYKVTR